MSGMLSFLEASNGEQINAGNTFEFDVLILGHPKAICTLL